MGKGDVAKVFCFFFSKKKRFRLLCPGCYIGRSPLLEETRMIDITFADAALPASGALGLLVAEGAGASGLWHAADEATGGAVTRAFAAAEFTGKDGQSCTILAPGAGLSRIVAVGLGKEGEVGDRKIEEAGGALAAALAREAVAALAADGVSGGQAALAAFGAVLRAYRFDLYRTKMKPEDKPKF